MTRTSSRTHIKDREVAALWAVHDIGKTELPSLETAMKVTSILTCDFHLIWDHLTETNLKPLIKAAYVLKRLLSVCKFTLSIYTSKETFLIQNFRAHYCWQLYQLQIVERTEEEEEEEVL
jgi:hypothetical protein